MTGPVDILVVGAGPVGLSLALQAHAHGAAVRIVDRRPDPFRPSRALIMHPRTLEALRPLGVTAPLLERADTDPEVRLHLGRRTVPARLGRLDLPGTAFPHLTLVRQMDVETVLIDALRQRGIEVERDMEVIGTGEDAGAARATLRTPTAMERVTCGYLAGCDGPDSIVRRQAGIPWRGGPYHEEIVLADVELDPAPGAAEAFVSRQGLLLVFPLGERATWRVLATRPAGGVPQAFGQAGPPLPPNELQALIDTAGAKVRIVEQAWSARYRVQHRLAGEFRQGRRFIAGDAAHTWSPATGQGMNTGIQDAVNLGWKLAFAACSTDPDALLDSYDLERRPAASRLLWLTHLAFWLEASTGRAPSLLRAAAPAAAPLAPLLLGRKRLLGEGIAAMSRLRASYPAGSVVTRAAQGPRSRPRAGARLADATVTLGGSQDSLHAITASPGIHVLYCSGATPPQAIDLGPHAHLHRLDHAPFDGIVAVRPDGYIGFRGGDGSFDALAAWLREIGAT